MHKVRRVWMEILEVDRADGKDDFFFDLGGHSLAAAAVTAECEQLLGVPLQVEDIYLAPALPDYVRRILVLCDTYQELSAELATAKSVPEAIYSFLRLLTQLNPRAAAGRLPADAVITINELGEEPRSALASDAEDMLWDIARSGFEVAGLDAPPLRCRDDEPRRFQVSGRGSEGGLSRVDFVERT